MRIGAGQIGGMQPFRLEDSGVGSAPADQPRLFEKFYRARGADTTGERGWG